MEYLALLWREKLAARMVVVVTVKESVVGTGRRRPIHTGQRVSIVRNSGRTVVVPMITGVDVRLQTRPVQVPVCMKSLSIGVGVIDEAAIPDQAVKPECQQDDPQRRLSTSYISNQW
ncbi:MAG: hypothetical protein ACOYXR_06185 [Nitrospirota bacterium]